jgi:hypothetical protein
VSLAVRGDGAGFRDTLSFDFIDPDAGVSGLVRVEATETGLAARGVVLTPEGQASCAPERAGERPDDWGAIELDGIRVSDDGDRASVSMEAADAGFEVELNRLTGAVFEPGSAFSDVAGVTQEPFAAHVEGEWRSRESSGRIATVGRVVRTSGETDWDRVELVRSLTVGLDDGSMLAVASARPAGTTGHGDEAASALLAEGDSLVRFDEPLISTEYDPAGEPRRVGVELWPADEDAAVARGAGTLVARAGDTTFLRFTLDGKPGTARYELVRPS